MNKELLDAVSDILDGTFKKGRHVVICSSCKTQQPEKNVNNWDNLCDNKKCGSRNLIVAEISDCGRIFRCNGVIGYLGDK